MHTDNTTADNNRAKVLGGQTCLPCRDEYGVQRKIQTAAGGGGKLVVCRRLHSSLIAEEVTSARNTTTALAAVTPKKRTHNTQRRSTCRSHGRPSRVSVPIAKGVGGNESELDHKEKS